jgi:urease accessory protein
MARDAALMRGDGPFVFAQVRNGVGVDAVVGHVLRELDHAPHRRRARPAPAPSA